MMQVGLKGFASGFSCSQMSARFDCQAVVCFLALLQFVVSLCFELPQSSWRHVFKMTIVHLIIHLRDACTHC